MKALLFFDAFIFYTIFKGEISLRTELRHFCNVLICVTAFHTVLGTFEGSYCHAITLAASASRAVSEDNWVLRFEA